MKSLSVKIIIAVLSVLVVAGATVGILIATGTIGRGCAPSGYSDDEKETSSSSAKETTAKKKKSKSSAKTISSDALNPLEGAKKSKTDESDKKSGKKKSEKSKSDDSQKTNDPYKALDKVMGQWGGYKGSSGLIATFGKDNDVYTFTAGVMWTDYIVYGYVKDIEQTGTKKYDVTVFYPAVDNELESSPEHTEIMSLDITDLSANKITIDDTTYDKITTSLEDYFS
ncbi:MAG: hypothetical protein J5766_03540 [Clostridia bacterium]|nr:hypothetical protein [Clostridia bacterium]